MMDEPKRKPVGVDVIDIMMKGGGHKPPPSSDDEPDAADMPDEDDAGLPPDFEAAFKQYQNHPSAQSFWDAVEACVSDKKSKSRYE